MKRQPATLYFLFLVLLQLMFSCRPEHSTSTTTITGQEKQRVIKQLDSVFNSDQQPRQQLMMLIEKHGAESKEVKDIWAVITRNDVENLVKVKAVLDQYGWLSAAVVGDDANSALFLVIQHADLKTWEKYVPLMREAVKNKAAKAADLAKLEDRLALEQGEKQLYGTQLGLDVKTNRYYVFPIADPDHVDARRKEMGLDSIHRYLSAWGIKWDLEDSKIKWELEGYKKETGI